MKKDTKYREIPYNYTSFSDREIILKYFDQEVWNILNELRKHRITGRSAKLFFEILGDIFIIDRNPYIFNDFLENRQKQFRLQKLHLAKLQAIQEGTSNPLVFQLIEKAKEVDRQFFENFSVEKKLRKRVLRVLGDVTSRNNIHFSAFHKVTHVTDATDWRVEYPTVVVYPESVSEIVKLVAAAKKTGLRIITRGGGTGLTGGAVPVFKNTMVVNLEKMRRIDEITFLDGDGGEKPVVNVQAGVVTDNVTSFCRDRGFVFATDPTSAWASTIGGNIAENCGGKKAVIWGTAIDNIYSYRIVNSEGRILEVMRKNHPYRKILPEDEVLFDVYRIGRRGNRDLLKTIKLKGTDIRRPGIGKDVTNKALGGLPGMQKEGGDGIIVSASFVLYRPFDHVRTVCLEFFGNNLINASKAIVAVKNYFENNSVSFLTALEHFDEKYVVAINYRNKSDRGELPKAVLLIDVESNDPDDLDRSCAGMLERVAEYNCEGFIAENEKAAVSFWQDRKNLGAIAKHTNAFKLNEDVVLPIESLPDFADYIEKLNMVKELENNSRVIAEIRTFLLSLREMEDSFILSKIASFEKQVEEHDSEYRLLRKELEDGAESGTGDSTALFEKIRDGQISIDVEKDVIERFRQTFHGYDDILMSYNEAMAEAQARKIVIATHLHAGDGNNHVNIPVNSNDYLMMQDADRTAGEVIEKTKTLGGVISGEHGIGLTKLKYIDREILEEYAAYKKENDPDDLFNPGKLTVDFPLSSVYTPSLNLLKMEAFILEAADLKDLTGSISACVRCGKCKEVCNTHYPGENMFFSPRNKILGVSLITEAVLYEAQTRNSLTFRNFKMLREISDHCTMCHNCYAPCPVNIDFGNVTLAIRKILLDRKRSKFKAVTAFTLFYLRRRGYFVNKVFRIALLKMGYTAQRTAHVLNRPFSRITGRVMPKVNSLLRGRLPRAGNMTLRELLKLKGAEKFFCFQNPEMAILKSVVYFPGCGSERMFPDISMATIALMYYAGVRVVIPPEYLCCGYPFIANGRTRQAEMKSYENRVIFHRMAGFIGYMNIEDIIVSCGTCFEMLEKYQLENIFTGAKLIDINEFVAREGLFHREDNGRKLLYHDPCHSPLRSLGYERTFQEIFETEPVSVPNCCGEGGTMALSTPDISNSIRERKRHNILETGLAGGRTCVLTTCPSCVQGLSRIREGVNVQGKSLAVFLAEEFLGKNWKNRFLRDVKSEGAIETIIL